MVLFKKKRVSFDLHGTIDSDLPFFKRIMAILLERDWEVYIITGMEKHKALKEIEPYELEYTDLLSVIDHHKEIGTKITYDENGNPWIDEALWNKTKAEICHRIKSSVHIDDQDVYEMAFYEDEYIGTVFLLFNSDDEDDKNYIETVILAASLIIENREGEEEQT